MAPTLAARDCLCEDQGDFYGNPELATVVQKSNLRALINTRCRLAEQGQWGILLKAYLRELEQVRSAQVAEHQCKPALGRNQKEDPEHADEPEPVKTTG